MLSNYVLIALRNMRREPGYSAINVFGLGVGMAACLLIGLFVWQERTYDRFHENADRLYRAWIEHTSEDRGTVFEIVTPIVLGPALEEAFPEVEAIVRVREEQEIVVGFEDRRFTEVVQAVDPAFFHAFTFPLLQGEPATALAGSGRVVLSEEMAARYFPDRDPMGHVLPLGIGGQMQEYVVSGIMKTPPVASSIQYGILIPFDDVARTMSESFRTGWFSTSIETYVLAREGVTAADLDAKFPSLVQQVIREDRRDAYTIGLQPITDINLGRTLSAEVAPAQAAYRQYLSLLTMIALFVLLVAAINFVTLSLGQSTRRSREVGLRKAVGAQRTQVAVQFWGEALVLATIALGLGVGIAWLLTPSFSDLAGVELAFGIGPQTLGVILVLLTVVGLGAGAYPAVVLSSLRPIEALKDRLQISGDRSLMRRGLVVVQFGMAILLIIGTLFVGRQLDFLRSAPLGFAAEQAVIIPTGMGPAASMDVLDRFRDELSGHPAIEMISAAAFALDEDWAEAGYTDATDTYREFRLNWGEADFLEVSGVELAAGRFLDRRLATDSMRIVVNETLVRDVGWASPEDALGRSLPGEGFTQFEIVGVVRDFHFASLRDEIEPLVYTVNPNPLLRGASMVGWFTSFQRKLQVRIASTDVPATLETLRHTWARAAPDAPFNYYFLDEAVQTQYVQEERLSRITSTASMLAILIAALGLFALATLSVLRRRKEIGVRKVLGAGTAGIVALLSKDFLMLVAVAFVIAVPVAYLGVSRWLESFAYRIEPGVAVFAAAGVLAGMVAFAAVSYHALRAASADPVKALRSE
jgi:putative ABC transport system permease protein